MTASRAGGPGDRTVDDIELDAVNAFDRLHPALQHHIVNSLGWGELRPVQDLSIDAFLDGANLVVLAPTAGGKTEAAFFPVISQMLAEAWAGPQRPLRQPDPCPAEQSGGAARALLRTGRAGGRRAGTATRRRARSGGSSAEPPDCLLTTPESLEVLLVSTRIDHRRFFRNVRAVVIDELHAFAGDDRGWHLLSVLARIRRLAGRDIQRVGLSATVGNPAEMLEWLSSGSARGRQVVRPPPGDRKRARGPARLRGLAGQRGQGHPPAAPGREAAGLLRQPVAGRAAGPAAA